MNNADGYVIIGTDLKTDKFQIKLKKLEHDAETTAKKIEKAEAMVEYKGLMIDEAEEALSQLETEYDEVNKKIERYIELEEKSNKGTLEMEEALQYYSLVQEQLTDEASQLEEKIDLQREKVEKANYSLEQQKELLEELKYKQGQLAEQKAFEIQRFNIEEQNRQLKEQQKELSGVQAGLDKIGTKVEGVIKKVIRWGLAVFGIRSAYLFVRQAISTLSQYDDQLKADIDYIKTALAYAIEPIARAVVNLVKQLLFYIGYIIKAWTGKNIFEKANKALKGANSEAKKLSKTLAGFDEMNVLQDNTSTSSGGAVAPSFDLSNLEDMEVPKWLQTIVDVGKWIIDNWEDVVGLLLLTKLFFDIITGNWAGVIIDIILFLITQMPRLWDAIKVVWDGLVAFGKWLWDGIVYIFTHLQDIIGAIGDIIGHIIQFIIDLFVGAIKKIIEGFVFIGNKIKDVFNGVVDFFKKIISTIIGLFKEIGAKAGNVIGSAFKSVINAVLKSMENILNTPIKSINSLIKTINKVPGINLGKLTTFKLPRLAKGGIVNMPGRGIPVGSAIGGEHGAEGVIPLTDSQQMALLGEAIGKYITINANITNTMNGRVISRELQKINNESDFAFNR